jgi:hypothetical protein
MHMEARKRKNESFIYVFVEPVTEEEIEKFQDIGRKKVAAFEKAAIEPNVADVTNSSDVNMSPEDSQLDPASSYSQLDSLQDAARELLEEAEAFERLDSNSPVDDRKLSLDSLISKTTALKTGLDEIDASLAFDESADNQLIEQVERIKEVELKQSLENTQHVIVLAKVMPNYAPKQRQVMGWTIHTRSRINNQLISGPPELINPDDEWTIEYLIDELPADKIETLYDACVVRKSLAGFGAKSEKEAERYYRSSFFRDLEALGDKGAKWRRERDALDEEMGPPVLFEDKWGKRDGRLFANGMGVKDVDEYVEWLYQGGRE